MGAGIMRLVNASPRVPALPQAAQLLRGLESMTRGEAVAMRAQQAILRKRRCVRLLPRSPFSRTRALCLSQVGWQQYKQQQAGPVSRYRL